MHDSDNHIPILTDIAHPGKQDMLNHFDGHQFEDESDVAFSVETVNEDNTRELESTPIIENADLDEIPSITLENDAEPGFTTEDFSEAMQSATTKTAELQLDKNHLKEKINQAISEALPGIEAQLKGKLYSKFGI